MKIDAHHHLWDLQAVFYPWLAARGQMRFFGDPSPIQRTYNLAEFQADAGAAGMQGSVHIQVGAQDAYAEAAWVQRVAEANPNWPLRQVAFCDLTSSDLNAQLDRLQGLSTVVGVRQIIARAPGEDSQTGTRDLLRDARFLTGLREISRRGLSFDLQLLPEVMAAAADVFSSVPDLPVALCHAGSPHDRSLAGLKSYSKALKRLSDLPNMFCKISGLGMFDPGWSAHSAQPIIEICNEQFGPQRLMFGSNFPVDSLSSSYEDLIARHRRLVAPRSAAHQRMFWGQTAAQFYRFA